MQDGQIPVGGGVGEVSELRIDRFVVQRNYYLKLLLWNQCYEVSKRLLKLIIPFLKEKPKYINHIISLIMLNVYVVG